MRMLILAQVRVLFRDRQSLFWAIAFPLIFLTVFRLFSVDAFGTTELTVGGRADTEVGQALTTALTDLEFMQVAVEPGLDVEGGLRRIEEDETSAVLIVGEPGAGGATEVDFIHGIEDPLAVSSLVAAVESVVSGVNLALTGAPQALQLTTRSAGVDDISFFEFVGPGIIGMGLMTFSTISLAASLARYRDEGVMRRLRATPLPPWKFFAGVVGSYLLVATLQVLVLVVYAQVLGVDLISSLGAFMPLALLGNLVFLVLGVVIAGLVQGRYAVEGAANAVTMPMMFLSGSFFPTEALPDAVQFIVEVLPLTHLLRALRGVSLDNEAIWQQGPEVLWLLGWAALLFVTARRVFRLGDA